MRVFRRGVVGAMLALALLAGACGDSGDDADVASEGSSSASGTGTEAAEAGTCAEFEGTGEITVGSTNFSEQEIVGELYLQCLEAAGFDAEEKFKIGARELVFAALERGDIDVYPEYVGTLLTFLNKSESPKELDAALGELKPLVEAKGIVLLEPSDAEDKNGFAVTKATADKYKLTKLSDLAPAADELVFGAGPECPERPLCLKGLESLYGLKFKEVKRLDSGGPLTKDALEKGDIQVGLIFTSDGAVAARGFIVLEDDKGLQPPENLVPAIRKDAVEGDVEELLNSISAKLTTENLSEMNKKVDVDKADPSDVAKEFLEANGFI